LCDTLGLCIIYPEYHTDTTVFHLKQYNTQLEEVFHCTTTFSSEYEYSSAAYLNGMVGILYQKKNKKKMGTEGIYIRYDCLSHQWQLQSVSQLPAREIQRFSLTKQGCLFEAELEKRMSNLFFLTDGEQQARPLVIDNAPSYIINDFVEDTANQHLYILLNTNPYTNDNVLWLCETDATGKPLYVVDLPDTGAVRFENARMIQSDSNRLLIIGTYVSRKSSANGTFTIRYANRRFSAPQLFPLQDNQQSGSTSSEISTLQSNIFHNNGKYAFVQEAFHPEYRYSTYYEFGVPTTEPVFIGYRFRWAFVEFFDSTGTRLWTYQFTYDDLLVTNLTCHLRVCIGDENILFYYLLGQELCTMLTNDQLQIIDPKRTTTLFANENKSEQLIYTTSLLPWYKNKYLLSGYRFKANRGKNKTPVYFLHKLEYR